MLYSAFVVAQYMSKELEEYISPADIEEIEEWAYTLRVKVKGKRYRFFSKKKIQQQYSRLTETGGTLVKLSPRVVLTVEADENQQTAIVGCKKIEWGMWCRDEILKYRFAESADIRPAQLAEGNWELVLPALRLDLACSFAFEDLREDSQETAGVSP